MFDTCVYSCLKQVYYEHVHRRCGHRDSPMSVDSLPMSSQNAVEKTRDVLQSTNRATRKVLSCVSDAKWWKKTLGSLRPAKRDVQQQQVEDQNAGFSRLGCHPFYELSDGHCFHNKVSVILEKQETIYCCCFQSVLVEH
jgi:hypothetical protein